MHEFVVLFQNLGGESAGYRSDDRRCVAARY